MADQLCSCGSYPGSTCPHPVRCGISEGAVDVGGRVPSLFEVIRDELGAMHPEALLWDGFEDALVGICYRFNQPPLALYDKQKCLEILMERDGMDYEGAVECFDFNTAGAWAGEGTPAYASFFDRDACEVTLTQAAMVATGSSPSSSGTGSALRILGRLLELPEAKRAHVLEQLEARLDQL